MASWPTLKEVRGLLRLSADPAEDTYIQSALDAAVDYGMRRLGQIITVSDGTVTVDWKYPADTTVLPDAGHQAALIHAGRLYRRRDSIDGTLGFGDAGVVRVGRFDADVEALYSSLGPLVFG